VFPVTFEDKDNIFTIYGDVYGGVFQVKKEKQTATPD
jgi:hypothetical protein